MPQNPAVQGKCPCRAGLVQALQMLLRSGLSSLVDFQSFAFVTRDYFVGGPLTTPAVTAGAYDNLPAVLTGSFSRFTPCACDYIDVGGAVFLPYETATAATTGLTVSRLDLCDILAVAFAPAGATAEELTANYTAARQLIQNLLQPGCGLRPTCPPYPDPCDEPCPCDCQNQFLGGSVSLITGSLLIAGATVLGNMGKVLILANDTLQRFYFVCSDKASIIQ